MTTVVMTGTATEVGKTWWGRATIETLRTRGVDAAARKPVQSYAVEELGSTDAEVLARASGEPVESVCPEHRWYPVPMAPPMAADALGLPSFTIGDLVGEIEPAATDAVVFVEGAGGPRSPLAADGDTVTLARALNPRFVVLVAPAGLGAINAVRLGAAACHDIQDNGARLVVALNHHDADDDLHRRNHGWLAADGFRLVLSPAELAGVLRP